MNKSILKVCVDQKELDMKKKTIAFFSSKKIETEEKLLGDFGDVALFLSNKEWLNIERKTFSDFVTSYIDGHIQDQAVRMNNVSNNYCVIVYGNINDLKRLYRKYPALKRITQRSVDKMARTLEMVYKCPVFFVENEVQYFQEILNIVDVVNRKKGETLKTKSNVVMKNRPDVNILTQADHLGQKTALMLLKHFKTPEKVLNASRQELKSLKGVGDSTIADIKDLKEVFYEGL